MPKLWFTHMAGWRMCELHRLPRRSLPILELPYLHELHGVRRGQDIFGGRLLVFIIATIASSHIHVFCLVGHFMGGCSRALCSGWW
jgi:hypothetical protein